MLQASHKHSWVVSVTKMNIKVEEVEDLDSEVKDRDNENLKVVFGNLHIIKYDDRVEAFIFDPKEADVFLSKMRARMNSHRFYRFFYFKTNKENFEQLEKFLERDEKSFIEWLKSTDSVTIERV